MSKKDTATVESQPKSETKQKHDSALNIYQRMIEVQKLATTVVKSATVKMSENDKGYKAVTHDEVAATLHLPLAQCGVFMLPEIVSYKTDSFEKTNQWGKQVTWYRTDLEILVKWVNVDKPDEFITSKGAAFALDTSDKSFAKAYSLALKIVLLKVHLLESRDGEEERPFDKENGMERVGKGEANQGRKSQPKNENQGAPAENSRPKPESKPVAPKDIVYPFESSIKGQKLGDIETSMLDKAKVWLKAQLAKDPKPANVKQVAFIYSQVKAVLVERTPPPPEQGPDAPMPDAAPEDAPQSFPEDESQAPNAAADHYRIPAGAHAELEKWAGRELVKISEGELREIIKIVDREMKKWPSAGLNPSAGFEIRGNINEFFKSVGV